MIRSPEPRRPPLWRVTERGTSDHAIPFYEWTCLLCESGTGQAPTHQQADNDAHIHWRANHNHQETRA